MKVSGGVPSHQEKGGDVINGTDHAMSHAGLRHKVKARFTELKAILSYGTPNQLRPRGAQLRYNEAPMNLNKQGEYGDL